MRPPAGLSHDLLAEVLSLRVCLGLGRPDDARRHLERAFLELAALDAAMPHELPAAPAAGPRQMKESHP